MTGTADNDEGINKNVSNTDLIRLRPQSGAGEDEAGDKQEKHDLITASFNDSVLQPDLVQRQASTTGHSKSAPATRSSLAASSKSDCLPSDSTVAGTVGSDEGMINNVATSDDQNKDLTLVDRLQQHLPVAASTGSFSSPINIRTWRRHLHRMAIRTFDSSALSQTIDSTALSSRTVGLTTHWCSF